MSAVELDPLTRTDEAIARTTRELKAIKTSRSEAIGQGNEGRAVELNRQLRKLQDPLEDLVNTREALQSKLRVYKGGLVAFSQHVVSTHGGLLLYLGRVCASIVCSGSFHSALRVVSS